MRQVLKVKEVFLATLILLILSGKFLTQAVPIPDFPIGLILVYEIEDEYYDLTIHATESYEVIEWTSPNNASFLLHVGYAQDGTWDNITRKVNYTSWEFTFSEQEFNDTGRMVPLWRDVTDWESGLAITLLDINFTIIGIDNIEVQDSSISCWVLDADYIGANEWEFYNVLYYDTQYGILMMKYLHRWAGIEDFRNTGTFTTTLVASNILDIITSPSMESILSSIMIDLVLVLGITVEIFAILVIKGRKRR
ncbi:MAG: hypothetical protein ACFFEA_04695 [Candidatus Thorarchaeota archaeon]